tara:strand:- start:1898 stop:2557 length:660 start_codon:yes stop_codon:yes gene_type:complete
MLEKQILIKKKKIYKKKYIGIILLYHFSPSLLKKKEKKKLVTISEDTNEHLSLYKKNKLKPDRHKHFNSIKINVSRLLLKDGKYFFTIDYIDNYNIVKGVKEELNISKKYIKKHYLISKKEFDIYVVDINKDIKIDSDSEYHWYTYMDFYKEYNDYEMNDIYENILDNNSLHLLNNEDIIENDHIEKYLFSEYDETRKIIKISKIYSKLIGDNKYIVNY